MMPREPATPPADFVDLRQVIPELEFDLRYYSGDNFMGRPLAGYEAERLLITRAAAEALRDVTEALAGAGLGLKVFDAYRPRRAVAHILDWAREPESDPALKAAYYPHLSKEQLLSEGYLVPDSSHSRGSTVDLTLVDAANGEELDMGTPFDFFDPRSWPLSEDVGDTARANRLRLREAMLARGFAPLETEWWHFTLVDEPYPDTWFDFPIRP